MKGKIHKMRPTIKSFPLIILIAVISMLLNSYFYKLEYFSSMEMRDEIKNEWTIQEWEIVEQRISCAYNSLIFDTKFMSKKIEAAILREYGEDIDILYEEFKNGIFSDRLYKVLKKEIIEDSYAANATLYNEDYNFLLGFKDGIFSVFKNTLGGERSETLIGWSDYFSDMNPDLSEELSKFIASKDINGKILLYQTGEMDTVIVDHSMSALKKVYENEGIEGFKKISFVSVAYITENGDIFDNNDFDYLEEVKNYKLVLVQHGNVYDAISNTAHKDLKINDLKYEKFIAILKDVMIRKSISFTVTNALLIIIVLVFSIFYNKNFDDKESS